MVRKISIVATIALILVVCAAVGYSQGYRDMGPGMMGGYGMGPGYGYGQGYGRGYQGYGPGRQSEACGKFLDDTKDLRRQLNEKRYDYSEAMRNPATKPRDLERQRKEIGDLQAKIHAKNPLGCRWFGDTFAMQGESQEPGQVLYNRNCAMCHGVTGRGNGPAAMSVGAPPANFTDPRFWGDDAEKRIRTAVQYGYGAMPPINLTPGEVKAISHYMSEAFRK